VPRLTPTVTDILSGPTATAAWVQRPPARGRRRPTKEEVELLAQVPLFAHLSTRHLRRIAGLTTEVRHKPGTLLVQEGTPGETFHVIVDGDAKVVRGGRTIARLTSGEFFGEIALLDGGPRTASVVALTPLRTLRLPRRSFHAMLKVEPTIAVAILGEVTARLRRRESPRGD
jgi:CRP-like cAMP-binding protein